MITILKDEAFRTAMINAIAGANREILIATYKLGYADRLSTRHINATVEALHRAAKRGVKVRCLLNMDQKNSTLGRINARAKKLLTEKGILTRTGPARRTYHAKLIIIDGVTALIGSHNLSESSLCRNFEISLMITSGAWAKKGLDCEWGVVEKLRQIYQEEWGKGR